MVRIDITKSGYLVRGHADYDEHGYDIVCSAISALTQTIALSLERYCKAKVQVTVNGVVVDIDEPTSTSHMLLDTMLIGLKHIRKEYPKHLEIRVQKGVFK